MAWKSVYLTARKEKRYRVNERDANGKQVSKSFVRSKDADAYMLELTRRNQLGHLWEDKPQTFGEFAGLRRENERVVVTGDGWFERYKTTVRDSTYDRRKDVIRHLAPFLSITLDRITPALVEDAVLSVQKKHPRQARFLHDTIRMVLRAAQVRGQRINATVLEMPSPAYASAKRPKALSHVEVELLANESYDPHLVRVAAYTGLRQGELFALRDQDIDLDEATITVSGTAYDGVRHEHAKTEAGVRTINVAPQVVEALRAQIADRRDGAPLVFPSPRGFIQRPQHFDPAFKAAARRADLDITFHDLRHTYASLMVKAGTHPKVLQEMMGHKTFNITMALYTHLDDSQREAAASALGEMLAAASQPH